MIVVIVLSCISYVLATDPTIRFILLLFLYYSYFYYRYQPSKCPNPVCSYDTLCPDREVCEPIPPHGFNVVEIFCIVIFTTDYIIRILLVGFMPPRFHYLFNSLFIYLDIFLFYFNKIIIIDLLVLNNHHGILMHY